MSSTIETKGDNSGDTSIDSKSCHFCNSDDEIEMHHIFPARFDGSDGEENLVPLCHTCHMKVEDLYRILLRELTTFDSELEKHIAENYLDFSNIGTKYTYVNGNGEGTTIAEKIASVLYKHSRVEYERLIDIYTSMIEGDMNNPPDRTEIEEDLHSILEEIVTDPRIKK